MSKNANTKSNGKDTKKDDTATKGNKSASDKTDKTDKTNKKGSVKVDEKDAKQMTNSVKNAGKKGTTKNAKTDDSKNTGKNNKSGSKSGSKSTDKQEKNSEDKSPDKDKKSKSKKNASKKGKPVTNMCTLRINGTFNVNDAKREIKSFINAFDKDKDSNYKCSGGGEAYSSIAEILAIKLIRDSAEFNQKSATKADLYEFSYDNIQRGIRKTREYPASIREVSENYDPHSMNFSKCFYVKSDVMRPFLESKALANTTNILIDENTLNFIFYMLSNVMTTITRKAFLFCECEKHKTVTVKHFRYACDDMFTGELHKNVVHRLDEISSIVKKSDGNDDKEDKNDEDNDSGDNKSKKPAKGKSGKKNSSKGAEENTAENSDADNSGSDDSGDDDNDSDKDKSDDESDADSDKSDAEKSDGDKSDDNSE